MILMLFFPQGILTSQLLTQKREHYFAEVKSEKEINTPLGSEQEKMKRVLDRATKKSQYEVWYFSDEKGQQDKILVKCL